MPNRVEGPEIVAVIPALNEASRIHGPVQAALRAECIQGLVVIDDGSVDGTLQRASFAAVQEQTTKPYVLAHQPNGGKTEALRRGVKLATELSQGALTTLVFLDADSMPIWSRGTKENMKLWQVGVSKLPGAMQEPVNRLTMDARHDAFVTLLAEYIDEIAKPVIAGEEVMRVGMYQRNVVTDTLLTLLKQGGHAGNRALPLVLWEGMERSLAERRFSLDSWEIEGALVSYAKSADKRKQGAFTMYGVVNVGSRVKAGSFLRGIKRMGTIHTQALKGRRKF